MRGSTNALATALDAGKGSPDARQNILGVVDTIFASVVITPLVVVYWKSTWSLMDLYIKPDDLVTSAVITVCFGLWCDFVMCVFQGRLNDFVVPDRGKLVYCVMSRLYTCLAGASCIAHFRGIWYLLDEFTGFEPEAVFATTGSAVFCLILLRALKNICAVPFAVTIDWPEGYFEIPTMFRMSSRETILYILDCVFSVTVVGSLVVFVWRGSWALLDIFLFPDDQAKSCWTSLVVGYAVVVATFSLQAPIRWAAARLHGAPRLLLADVYHMISFVATVNVWRGVWGLLDIYFFPETPKLSNWCSHIISLALLIVLNCSNSVIVRGVYIDAEEPAGECVVFPCHYLRLFFHKEKTKKRHKQALAAAAAASARKSEEACVPLQMPEEKV